MSEQRATRRQDPAAQGVLPVGVRSVISAGLQGDLLESLLAATKRQFR
ncbi:MAG: hypothetical protein H0V12_06735 [Chloroflexi bacterium]|nr:hypothetical protein [Chloroflexota bacterium]